MQNNLKWKLCQIKPLYVDISPRIVCSTILLRLSKLQGVIVTQWFWMFLKLRKSTRIKRTIIHDLPCQ